MVFGSVMRLATTDRVVGPKDLERIEVWTREHGPDPVMRLLRVINGLLIAGRYSSDCNASLVRIGHFDDASIDAAKERLLAAGWRNVCFYGRDDQGVTLQLWP